MSWRLIYRSQWILPLSFNKWCHCMITLKVGGKNCGIMVFSGNSTNRMAFTKIENGKKSWLNSSIKKSHVRLIICSCLTSLLNSFHGCCLIVQTFEISWFQYVFFPFNLMGCCFTCLFQNFEFYFVAYWLSQKNTQGLFRKGIYPHSLTIIYIKDIVNDWDSHHLLQCGWHLDCPKLKDSIWREAFSGTIQSRFHVGRSCRGCCCCSKSCIISLLLLVKHLHKTVTQRRLNASLGFFLGNHL